MWCISVRLFLLTTLCLCIVTHAQKDMFHFPKRSNDRIRVCGKYLSDFLQIACNGIYNSMFKKAEKVPEPETEYWWNEPASAEEQLPYPLKSLPKASSFFHSSHRQKRQGIHDECCRKSCTISEVRSYCGPS